MKALPSPSKDEEQSQHSQEHQGTDRSPQDDPIPSVDDLLRQLVNLNGAVVMRIISPQIANLVQKNIKILIDVQLKRDNGEHSVPDLEALVEMCRQNPRSLNTLASFLTPSQLQSLMEEIQGV